jgi:DNA repair photolyase
MACTSDDDLIAFTLACSVGCHFCFIYAFCIYLRILVSNTISKSDDARVV